MAEKITKPVDPAFVRDKEKVMHEGRTNAFFYSLSDTFKYIAGIMTTIGMALVIPEVLKTVGATSAAGTAATFGSVFSAITSSSPVGLTFLAIAALSTAVAVSSQFISSRYHHATNYDALEANAKHTAKYLVKEIKKENACIAEQHDECRADGKTWAQAIEARRQNARQSQAQI